MKRRRLSYQTFWRTVTHDGRKGCRLAGARGPCEGPKDAHHYFPKQRIDWALDGRYGPRAIAAKTDVRNGVCLCRRHHDMVHQAIRPIACPAPPFYGLFLAEHGLHDRRPWTADPMPESTRIDKPPAKEQLEI